MRLLLFKIVSALAFLVSILLLKLGLRRRPDAWRRTVGVGLRCDASKFVLSAFGVRPLPPGNGEDLLINERRRQIARRFAEFLRTEPDASFSLRHDRFCTYRAGHSPGDLVLGDFSKWGELREISPLFDEQRPIGIDMTDRRKIEQLIIAEFNRTRFLPESIRCRELGLGVKNRCLRVRNSDARAICYAERILGAIFLSFEGQVEGAAERFRPPDFRSRRVLGTGFLNLVCREAQPDAIDVWMQVHHTGGDGAPMQEMLGRLEVSWGTVAGICFPSEGETRYQIMLCNAGRGERALCVINDFIDFSALLELRNDLKSRFEEPVPVGGLLLWGLAWQPEFDGVKFASAVDVPGNRESARGVDLVAIRPADYVSEGGFATFLRDFNRLIADGRKRCTGSYEAMYNLALLPPVLASAALRLDPGAGWRTFGTVGVSIVRDAKVVVGTIADRGFEGGFILIGNMSLPCANGRRSTSVSIKGEAAAIRGYPDAIRRAIRMARQTILGL